MKIDKTFEFCYFVFQVPFMHETGEQVRELLSKRFWTLFPELLVPVEVKLH